MRTVRSASLQCRVAALSYDFVMRSGVLVMGDDDCCDMTGCVNLFTRIDPRVIEIRTFQGKNPDTIYWIDGKGQWAAQ